MRGRRSALSPDVRARIVARRAAGASLRTIADELNADGVPTGQGGASWLPSAVEAAVRSVHRREQADRLADPPPRLSWGCGPVYLSGWHHSDALRWTPDQEHVGRIQDGLPWLTGTFDLVVSNHALQMVPWPELVPALAELRRVLRSGGVLRLLVPDLMRALLAYGEGHPDHFQVADEIEASIDGKLCVYLTQAGSSRSVFTGPWLGELLDRAGFVEVHGAAFGISGSDDPLACQLDSRVDESIIYEGTAP